MIKKKPEGIDRESLQKLTAEAFNLLFEKHGYRRSLPKRKACALWRKFLSCRSDLLHPCCVY